MSNDALKSDKHEDPGPSVTAATAAAKCLQVGCQFRKHSTQGHEYCCHACGNGHEVHGALCEQQTWVDPSAPPGASGSPTRRSFKDMVGNARSSLMNVEEGAITHLHTMEDAAKKSWHDAEVTREDLANQTLIAQQLPLGVRVVGVLLAFLAVICTWESIDHLVIHIVPDPKHQLVAHVILIVVALLSLWISKKLTDSDWIETGSFGFTIGSLVGAAATWGLVAAIVRIFAEKGARMTVWMMGSCIFLFASFVYMVLTKHNALLDIASCANSLGYFDKDDEEAVLQRDSALPLQSNPPDYKGCA